MKAVLNLIKSENLSFEYVPFDDISPPAQSLDDVSLSIEAGEFVAILGHNGSGKSTLAKHLNGLISPTRGNLWIKGLDAKDEKNLWEIRQSVGMVFQNPDNQIVATIVEEDIAFGPENIGLPPEEIRRRVDESLADVRMADYAKHQPHHLSGGQKQRVAIAGVLAMRPSCIVLDEPTAMLDPSGRKEVIKTITRLNKEHGITIILITHFMEEAAKANRIIVMSNGKAVMDDTPKNVFRHVETMNQLGLGVPQVTALAYKLREKGIKVSDTILNIEEFMQDEAIKNYSSNEFSKCESAKNETFSDFAQPQGSCKSDFLLQHGIIQVKNVTHTYNTGSVFEKKALDNITLEISQGEMVALIGHTGSGKSTLIQHLNALLKPTSGQVLIKGEDINSNKKKLKEIRQKVGLVFQYPEHQLFESTVYKDVAFGPIRMGLTGNELDSQVKAALKSVGLKEHHHQKSPFELSGGQKRRAAIAGVLAMHPEILILDEPAAGLDPSGREEILSQIKKMHKTLGITVILVSHSMDDAARLSDRILVMNQGKLILDGTPREVFSQGEMLRSIGLDIPQISELMSQLHKKNPAIPQGAFTVEDAAEALLPV